MVFLKGFEEVPCNLCGSKDFTVVYDAVPQEDGKKTEEKFGVTSSAQATERVVKCRKCGLVFINPRPSQSLVLKGYEKAGGDEYVSQADGRVETFRHSVELIEKLAFHGKKLKAKVLDVGSAAGFFLKAAKDAGWDSHGVEPNGWMVKWGNKKFGLKMQQGTLETAKFPKNSFDLVTMWDVLEHVPDPKKTLKDANAFLKPGGFLVINFPNIGSTLARIAGRRWWFLTSVHLYYFTPETLSKMLEQSGFEVVVIKRHYQKLNLGYMLELHKKQTLASGKSSKIHNVLISTLKAIRLYDLKVKYYASQTFVLARKRAK